MTRLRVITLLLTLTIVSVAGFFVALIARGYRFDIDTLKFSPNGIIVIKSDPDGASIIINGDLKGATNTNIKLSPDVYDIEVKKEGYTSWKKRLSVKKEEVTQVLAELFKTAPSLSPITFNGAVNPVTSENYEKIAYTSSQELWIMSVSSLPIGFPNGPKKIADGISISATYQFSPDAQQILLEDNLGSYLLDTNQFTPQDQKVNITSTKSIILNKWKTESQKKQDAETVNLPQDLIDLLKRKTSKIVFSPDTNMVMYQASEDVNLPENLTPKLPGSSTQPESRDIKLGKTYVYDIKEDKNFLVSDSNNSLYWLPTSKHLIDAQEGKIIVLDYDGTNRQTVFSGSYIAPHAYPYVNASKLLILTNFGSDSQIPNLYSLSIK